jgi:hypothetical protein
VFRKLNVSNRAGLAVTVARSTQPPS